MFFLLCEWFQISATGKQHRHGDDQCRQDEIGRPEDHQADHRAAQAENGRQMGGTGQPLFGENNDEQGRHGKINAGGVEGDDLSQQGAQYGSEDPVNMIQQRDQEQGIVFGILWRYFQGADQGIGFIGQGKYHVRVAPPHLAEFFQKRQPVKHVAAVDQQCHNGNSKNRSASCEKACQHELGGTGIDKYAHKKSPGSAVTCVGQEQTEGDTQEQIAEKDR